MFRAGALPWIFRYVPPDQARVVANVQASVSGSSASSTGSTPEVQPLKTLQLNKTPLRQVRRMHTELLSTHRPLFSFLIQFSAEEKSCFFCVCDLFFFYYYFFFTIFS